jgi:hypothetical protein
MIIPSNRANRVHSIPTRSSARRAPPTLAHRCGVGPLLHQPPSLPAAELECKPHCAKEQTSNKRQTLDRQEKEDGDFVGSLFQLNIIPRSSLAGTPNVTLRSITRKRTVFISIDLGPCGVEAVSQSSSLELLLVPEGIGPLRHSLR